MGLADTGWSDPPGDPARHGEALTLAASRHLRAGEPEAAFALIDRRCRLGDKPGAPDLAIRALASRLSGWPAFAADDLDRATAADPLDPFVNWTRLRLAGDEASALTAARALAAGPDTAPDARSMALARLFAGGERAIARLDLLDDQLTGWVAWTGERAPVLVIDEPAIARTLAADPAFRAPDGANGCFIDVAVPGARGPYRLLDGETLLLEGQLWPRSRRPLRPDGQALRRAPTSTPARAPLTIIVPVHADFAATRACLQSLVAEASGREDVTIVVVDDASPDRDIRLLLDALDRRGWIELRRNAVNLGFTGAVELGLRGTAGRDVLLLNADTVLPRGALRRLADAAYAAPDIGTATPLSNNGEYTSFPRHGEAQPAPAPEAAQRIDAVAERVNRGRVVDLPNGVGFCLFVRHDCLSAVGGMPAVYRRGYFEDLEFSVRARRTGFRNVCVASLYVVHHGTLSFKADKRALVTENLRLFRRRFPLFEAEAAAYVRADPLRGARGAIEAELAPAERPWLVAAPEGCALVDERLRHHRLAGRPIVRLAWTAVGGRIRITIRHSGQDLPQSLRLDWEADADRLRRFLRRMRTPAIEVGGAGPIPPGLADMLLALSAPIDVLLGDLPPAGVPDNDAAPLLAPFEHWRMALGERWNHVIATEPASFAAIRAHCPEAAARIDVVPPPPATLVEGSARPGRIPATLAILMAAPDPDADAFVAQLSAALRARRPEARLLVLGRTMDDWALMGRGNVFVTGAVEPDGYARIVAQSGATALALPYSSGFLALFERVKAEAALPGACLDWSFGARPAEPSSLFLDPRHRARDNTSAIVDWFAHRLEAPAP